MSKRIEKTTRTDDLGLRILAGQERRHVRDRVAFERAEFELEYEGKQIVAFDRSQVFRIASRILGDTNICVSDAFVRECQRHVPYMKRLIRDHG